MIANEPSSYGGGSLPVGLQRTLEKKKIWNRFKNLLNQSVIIIICPEFQINTRRNTRGDNNYPHNLRREGGEQIIIGTNFLKKKNCSGFFQLLVMRNPEVDHPILQPRHTYFYIKI